MLKIVLPVVVTLILTTHTVTAEEDCIWPSNSPLRAISFSGGGAKGIAYGGAVAALHRAGLLANVSIIKGTSAGSQAAALVAAGYSDENSLFNALAQTDISALLEEEEDQSFIASTFRGWRTYITDCFQWHDSIWRKASDMLSLKYLRHLASRIVRLVFQSGFYDGQKMEDKIDELVWKKFPELKKNHSSRPYRCAKYNKTKAKGEQPACDCFPGDGKHCEDDERARGVTFRELHNILNKSLHIFGTCLTTKELETFNKETTPHMSIAKAARLSSSIPLFFVPVLVSDAVNPGGGGADERLYVDGGLLRNVPGDADGEASTTLPLVFGTEQEVFPDAADSKIGDPRTLTVRSLETAMFGPASSNSLTRFRTRPMVFINTTISGECVSGRTVSAVDFSLNEYEKVALAKAGWDAVAKMVNKKAFSLSNGDAAAEMDHKETFALSSAKKILNQIKGAPKRALETQKKVGLCKQPEDGKNVTAEDYPDWLDVTAGEGLPILSVERGMTMAVGGGVGYLVGPIVRALLQAFLPLLVGMFFAGIVGSSLAVPVAQNQHCLLYLGVLYFALVIPILRYRERVLHVSCWIRPTPSGEGKKHCIC
jgi:exoenzyme U